MLLTNASRKSIGQLHYPPGSSHAYVIYFFHWRFSELKCSRMTLNEILAKAPSEPEAYRLWEKENFQEVKVTPQILHPNISEDSVIRRFVDLPKLLDLLVNRRLLLPQLASLTKGDPFECSAKRTYDHLSHQELVCKALDLQIYAPKFYKEAFLPISSGYVGPLNRTTLKSRYTQSIEKMSETELKEAVWFLEYERLKHDLACSCWYLGNSTESEDAMWKIFCGHLGVAIKTSVSRLKSVVSCRVPRVMADSVVLKLDEVIYDDRKECRNSEPWLIKRTAFRHENEVRLYVESALMIGPGFLLDVNPAALIEEIVITPFAEKWQIKSIAETCELLLRRSETDPSSRSAHESKILKSPHMNTFHPTWPEAVRFWHFEVGGPASEKLLTKPG